MRGIDGRRILVVAGAGTIGTRVCVRLAEEGARVAASYGKRGIRANAVAPGLVLDDANGRPRDPAVLEHLLGRTLSDRLGRPDDVPGTVALLLSDDGAWINGQVISVDGGITHRP